MNIACFHDLGFGATHRLAEAFNWGKFVIVDGEKTQGDLSRFLNKARAVFITHLHMDHLGDYPTFLEIGDSQGIPWPANYTPPDPSKIWTAAETCPAMDPFEIYKDDLVRVTAILADHRQVYPAFAFRFDTADGSLAISGDTGPNTKGNLQKLAKDVDVLVHEVVDKTWIDATFKGVKQGDPAWPFYIHAISARTSTEDVGKVAQQCGAKTLVLGHIGPGNTPIKRLRKARRNFSGKLIIGEDLMQIGIGKIPSRFRA